MISLGAIQGHRQNAYTWTVLQVPPEDLGTSIYYDMAAEKAHLDFKISDE